MNQRKIKGSELTATDKSYVLACYVHRYTRTNIPSWARGYPVQFDSDQDWLEHTYFPVRKDGRLDMRYRYCESHPTWPDNPELKWPKNQAIREKSL